MQIRELVLMAGGPNVGKTTWLCQMALQHISPDIEIHMMDSERKIMGSMAMLTEKLPDNITIHPAVHAQQIIITLEDTIFPRFKGKKDGEVVVMIDMIDKWWEYSQEFYVEKLGEGKSLAEHMQEIVNKKKERGDRSPNMFEDSFIDWPVIKQWHNGRMVEPLLNRQPCHVFATASTRELRREGPLSDITGSSEKVKRFKIWEPFGQIAEGEKRNDFRFVTILGMHDIGIAKPEPEIELFNLKDRARKLGRPAELFYHQKLDVVDYIYDPWLEYASQTGAPMMINGEG